MVTVYSNKQKIIINNGKIAINQECCCCCCDNIQWEEIRDGNKPYSKKNVNPPKDPMCGPAQDFPGPSLPKEDGQSVGKWVLKKACLRWICVSFDDQGNQICSKEFGGPTINAVNLLELIKNCPGIDNEKGCFIYVIQFFGWYWQGKAGTIATGTNGVGWVSRDDIYSIQKIQIN